MPGSELNQDVDLAELVERYDPESDETYLTLYADLDNDLWRRALDARHDEVQALLGDERAEDLGFDASYETGIESIERLAKKGARGAAVFVSTRHGFHAAKALTGRVGTRLVLDSGPYVAPLAYHEDAYAPFLLVVIDGSRGAVWRVEAGKAELEGTKKMDLMGRHKKGGFSQMRYQRHRAGRVDDLMDQIIEHIEAAVREEDVERIIVAGPGQAKSQLAERLPQHLRERLDAIEALDLDDPRELPELAPFIRLSRDLEAQENEALAEDLRDAVRSGGLAVSDPFEAVRAARDGRVDTLLVLRDHTAGARKCEAHRSFFPAGEACACGAAGTEVDLVNEAIEHTLQSDGAVETVETDPFLEKRGGVGAFLRW